MLNKLVERIVNFLIKEMIKSNQFNKKKLLYPVLKTNTLATVQRQKYKQ